MPNAPGRGKTAVALFVDGLELKYVNLGMEGKKVKILETKTVPLVTKFEEKARMAAAEDGAGFGELAGMDAFATMAPTEGPTTREGETNASVLLSLLSEVDTRYSLSYALAEPAVTYHEFDTDFGLKGANLKKKLAAELTNVRTAPPLPDQLDTIPTATGGMLTVIREDGMHAYDLLLEISGFLGKKLPKLNIIDSADVALMNLVRTSYTLQEDEVTIIIYVGSEFSRLIFMQGNGYLHFAPIISEGFNSPNIDNTLYSRILLEQDNIGLTRIDRMLLAGDGHRVDLREAIAPQFPSAVVEYLLSPELDLGVVDEAVREDVVSEYAIPLATAWRALDPKREGFYGINLIPELVIEGQKAFKLAWHGWIVALLIIVSIVYFYTAILQQSSEIRAASELLGRRQVELNDLMLLRQQRDTLQFGIQRYVGATALYDSIAPGADRWSRILHYFSNSVEDLNSLWIYEIKRNDNPPNSLMISGRSVYRTRIPRLASLFEKATLKEVRTTTIRDKIIYEFDLIVEQLDKTELVPRDFGTTGR